MRIFAGKQNIGWGKRGSCWRAGLGREQGCISVGLALLSVFTHTQHAWKI